MIFRVGFKNLLAFYFSKNPRGGLSWFLTLISNLVSEIYIFGENHEKLRYCHWKIAKFTQNLKMNFFLEVSAGEKNFWEQIRDPQGLKYNENFLDFCSSGCLFQVYVLASVLQRHVLNLNWKSLIKKMSISDHNISTLTSFLQSLFSLFQFIRSTDCILYHVI